MNGHTQVRLMNNLFGDASEPVLIQKDPVEDNLGVLGQGVIGDFQEEL